MLLCENCGMLIRTFRELAEHPSSYVCPKYGKEIQGGHEHEWHKYGTINGRPFSACQSCGLERWDDTGEMR